MPKAKFTVTGMTCAACSARVEKAVDALPGTENVAVNLLLNKLTLTYDENLIGENDIVAAVEKAGYGVLPSGEENASVASKNSSSQRSGDLSETEISDLRRRLIWSAVFLIPLMYLAMQPMMMFPAPPGFAVIFHGNANAVTFALTQFLLVLPIMYFNRVYYLRGLTNLFRGAPNMDSLVGVGSLAAAVYGLFALYRIGYGLGHGDLATVATYRDNLYFDSAGMIVTLITVGKFLEAKAKGRTGEALRKLMDLAPQEATVIVDGREKRILAANLVAGDEIVVRPGEKIPADGIVLSGKTDVDESAFTGESMPAPKKPGDEVIASTINRGGLIRVEARRIGEDTAIAQVIRLVEDASATKAPIAKLADRVAGVFVPTVMLIALATGIFWLCYGESAEFAFSAAVSVLVISCPCALGLATPVALMVGIGRGAEQGILLKSGDALEIAERIDTVVLDKTGTITEGRPRILRTYVYEGKEAGLIALAAGLEQGSEHPLAISVLDLAKEKKIAPERVQNFRADFGRGVVGEIGSVEVLAGNERMMREAGIDLAPCERDLAALTQMGQTPLIFARERRLIGMMAAADTPKATSRAAIGALKKLGIKVIMLTGDNRRTAKAVAADLEIDEFVAEVRPTDKAQEIAKLKRAGRKVAMIGDGVNDAPALAGADLGIAIGAGTDIAIESADAVLIKNDLGDAVKAIELSRAVMLNIKENLFWAFFYNVLGIPLAAGVFYPAFGWQLSPMIGAAAMSMSSVCVVLNALRLKKFRSAEIKKAAENSTAKSTALVKEEKNMEKELKIEGMMCAHCQKHVHDALAKMDGVESVTVDLEGKKAVVKTSREIPQAEFAACITDAGYELVG